MKKFSLVMAMMLIISSLFVVPFAASADATDVVLFSYDGSSNTSLAAKNVSGSEIVDTTMSIAVGANTGKTHIDGTALEASAAAYAGKDGPQKSADDKVMHVDIKSTGSNVSGTSAMQMQFDYAKLVGAAQNYDYLTYDFDAYFNNDTSSVALRFTGSGNKAYSANVLASASAVGYVGGTESYNKSASYGGVEIKKWHKVRFQFPLYDTVAPIKIYLDDMTTPVTQTKANVVATEIINGLDVAASAARSALVFATSKNGDQDTYIDNLKVTVGSANVEANTVKPTLSSNNTNIVVDEATKGITYKTENLTAETLISNLTTDAAFKGVYADDLTTIRTGALQFGDVLVLGGSNGSYSYYTLQYDAVVKTQSTYKGDKTYYNWAASSGAVKQNTIVQAPQKASGNNAYYVKGDSANELGSGLLTAQPSLYTIYGASNAYEKIIIEYNIMPVSGKFNYGMRFWNGSATSNKKYGYELLIGGDSSRINSQIDTKSLSKSIETGKWSHIAFEFSHTSTTTGEAKLYVNNELVGTASNIAANTGFNVNSIYSSTATIFAAANSEFEFYVDDVEYKYTDEAGMGYVDGMKSIPTVSGSDIINVMSGATAEQIIASVTTDASFADVYQKDGITARTGEVLDGDIVAFGNNDGIYVYKTISTKSAYEKSEGSFTQVSASGYTVDTSVENGFKISTTSNSGTGANCTVAFPQSIDVSGLGNIYTLSFDVKHDYAAGVTSLNTAGNNYYLCQIQLNNQNLMQIFGAANAICMPTSSNGGSIRGRVVSSGYTTANDLVAGMTPGTTYRFQIVVDKNNSKVHLIVDDQYIYSTALSQFPVFNDSKFTSFKVMGRGGDGTKAIVEPTFSNFKAVAGYGDLQFKNGAITKNGSAFSVSYERYNLFGSAKDVKLVVAAYSNGSLIATQDATINVQPGFGVDTQNITYTGSADLSQADTIKAFFINDFENLKAYGDAVIK